MRNLKIIAGGIIVILIGMTVWQIASWELANLNFQEELRDLGSQAGTHIGFVVPPSDKEMVRTVIRKAEEHGIELRPEQVTVQRIGSDEKATMYLAADYTVPVKLPILSFRLHFTATSRK